MPIDLEILLESAALSPAPQHDDVDRLKRDDPAALRSAFMVERLWRAAHRQIATLEAELDRPCDDPARRESQARTMAMVSLALRDLAALDRHLPVETTFDADDPRAVPTDPDRFRMAVAFELDRLREQRTLLEE